MVYYIYVPYVTLCITTFFRGYAPAEEVAGEHKEHQTENQSVLGLVPHSIRGFLGRFEQVMCLSYAFKNCVACSEKVSS